MMRSPAQQLIPIAHRDGILAISLQGVELPAVGGEVPAEVPEPLGGFRGFFGVGLLAGEGGVGV